MSIWVFNPAARSVSPRRLQASLRLLVSPTGVRSSLSFCFVFLIQPLKRRLKGRLSLLRQCEGRPSCFKGSRLWLILGKNQLSATSEGWKHLLEAHFDLQLRLLQAGELLQMSCLVLVPHQGWYPWGPYTFPYLTRYPLFFSSLARQWIDWVTEWESHQWFFLGSLCVCHVTLWYECLPGLWDHLSCKQRARGKSFLEMIRAASLEPRLINEGYIWDL